MKNPFLFLRKEGGEKADANISMNVHGAFSTGGYGNAKIGGRTKGTYFLVFIPLFVFFIFALMPSTKRSDTPSPVERIPNPVQVVATIEDFDWHSDVQWALYTYTYNGKKYSSGGPLTEVKHVNLLERGDKIIITINKSFPERSCPTRRYKPTLH